MTSRAAQPRPGQAGFTLLELMLVLVILGIAAKLVLPALLQDIPEAAVQSEARQLAAKLSFLRTEARLQSGEYGIEIDGKHSCYRMVMPLERLLQKDSSPPAYETEETSLHLEPVFLTEDVVFLGVHVYKQDEGRRAESVLFDPSGRTPQKVIWLGHRAEKDLVYSIFVPALTGEVEVTKGRREILTATDADF
jgi:type II secretion system protein H